MTGTTSTAQHLATIDLLRARAFPAQRAGSLAVVSGPGYHIAELSTSGGFWEDDGTGRLAAREQYEAECGALSLMLSARWGDPQVFSLWSTLVRSIEDAGGLTGSGGSRQPWLELSMGATCLDLWCAEGKWIALGVSQQDAELPFQLLAAVTVNDPP